MPVMVKKEHMVSTQQAEGDVPVVPMSERGGLGSQKLCDSPKFSSKYSKTRSHMPPVWSQSLGSMVAPGCLTRLKLNDIAAWHQFKANSNPQFGEL